MQLFDNPDFKYLAKNALITVILGLILSMQETIERYRRHTKDTQTNSKSDEQNMQVVPPFSLIVLIIS
jgi:hypothetical protein